jgi:cell wall assembly regulator SMI1
MRETWTKIEEWLGDHAPKALASLRPGAPAEALAALEQRLGAPLPDELRAWLSLHDGQELRARAGLLDGWIFLPSAEIAKVHATFGDLLRRGDFAGNRATNDDGAVKPVWWSERWIPFLEGPGGDLLCFDTDPAERGTPGQIITFWKADGDRNARSPRLSPLLDQFLADLRGGAYELGRSGGLRVV